MSDAICVVIEKEFLTLKKWSEELEGGKFPEEEAKRYRAQIQKMSKALMAQRQVLSVTKEILQLSKTVSWS